MKDFDLRKLLMAMQIAIHIAFVYGMFTLPLIHTIAAILVTHVVFVGGCGTVLFHRVLAHKNKIKPWIENVLLALSTIGASGSAIAWVGTHRMHHRFSDTEQDPHSVKYKGLLKTYFFSSADKSLVRYVVDMIKVPKFAFQHKYYFQLLIGYHILIASFGSFELYWLMCIAPAFMMWLAGSTINCLSHDDKGAINSKAMGILFAGEGWHLNHHNAPASPNFNDRWDLGRHIYKVIKQNGKN